MQHLYELKTSVDALVPGFSVLSINYIYVAVT